MRFLGKVEDLVQIMAPHPPTQMQTTNSNANAAIVIEQAKELNIGLSFTGGEWVPATQN